MANNPKKVKDPTEVALSAIQEALNISDTHRRHAAGIRSAANCAASTIPSAAAGLFRNVVRHAREHATAPVFDPIEEPRFAASRRQ